MTTSDYEPVVQSLRDEFPTVTINFINEAICVRMLGFWAAIARKMSGEWEVNEDVRALVRNYVIFKKSEEELLRRDPLSRGAYLLINDSDSKFFCETQDSAIRNRKSKHSFVGRIGFEGSTEEILLLDALEKPESFDDFPSR